MKNLIIQVTSIIFLYFYSSIVLSHHAFTAEFDANAPINITGKVLKVEWINPHAWVHVEVEDQGKSTIWMVEGGTRPSFDHPYRTLSLIFYLYMNPSMGIDPLNFQYLTGNIYRCISIKFCSESMMRQYDRTIKI